MVYQLIANTKQVEGTFEQYLANVSWGAQLTTKSFDLLCHTFDIFVNIHEKHPILFQFNATNYSFSSHN